MLKNYIKGDVDISLTSETKLDESFRNGQSQMDGFSILQR